MDVKITFRSPPPETAGLKIGLHTQTIADVPTDEAERMVEDFTRYRTAAPKAVRRMRYQFDRNGSTVIVAIDFDHVVALIAAESGAA